MDDVKILYANGDSWTAGDIVDPEIFGDQLQYVMHPDNAPYRLNKVWPHIVGKNLGLEVVNNSYAGSSNDGIVRRTLNDIPKLLKEYKPEEIVVIIGWSSPERKDFFYSDGERKNWDTLYPAELDHWKDDNEDINDFYKIYVRKYWNEEEYIYRFITQTLLLSSYLKTKGIKHYFFNAFYEHKDLIVERDPSRHNIKHSPTLFSFIDKFYTKHFDNKKWLEHLGFETLIDEFYSVYNSSFFKLSFSELLVRLEHKEGSDTYLDYHPTDKGHQAWADHLTEAFKNDIDTLLVPEEVHYYIRDDFNQVELWNASDDILEIYKDVPEINEVDPNGNRMVRPLFSHSTLPFVMNFKPVDINEIDEDTHYFYFVTLHHHNFLAARHLNLLPEYVLTDLRKGRCKLVLDNTLEGDRVEEFLEELYKSLDNLNIQPERVTYITSNLLAEDVFKEWYQSQDIKIGKLNVVSFPWNIHDVKRLKREKHLPETVNIEEEIKYKKENFNKLVPFLKVNRTGRPERNLYMLFINKYNLYDKFKISFNKYYDEYDLFEFFPELIDKENIEDLKSKVPFDIDSTDRDNHGPPGVGAGKFNADLPFDPTHYRNTLISVVMCAFPFVEKACHIHSSTYNPIYCGHPILQFGPQGHLKKLRDLGFKTFDRWWDESYDDIEFGWGRFRAVLEITQELYNKSNEELLKMYEEMKDVLQHNSDLIANFDGEKELRKRILYVN